LSSQSGSAAPAIFAGPILGLQWRRYVFSSPIQRRGHTLGTGTQGGHGSALPTSLGAARASGPGAARGRDRERRPGGSSGAVVRVGPAAWRARRDPFGAGSGGSCAQRSAPESEAPARGYREHEPTTGHQESTAALACRACWSAAPLTRGVRSGAAAGDRTERRRGPRRRSSRCGRGWTDADLRAQPRPHRRARRLRRRPERSTLVGADAGPHRGRDGLRRRPLRVAGHRAAEPAAAPVGAALAREREADRGAVRASRHPHRLPRQRSPRRPRPLPGSRGSEAG